MIVGVTDDGPGIETDKLRSIFERFTQLENDTESSTKGVGLGLAIVKDFVALNLGEIAVDSTRGNGSTFSFALPQAEFPRGHGMLFRWPAQTGCGRHHHDVRSPHREPYDPAMLPVVDEFLQRNLRPDDLAYMTSPGQWRMFSSCSPDAEEDRLEQIRLAWTEECRNWIYGTPPQIGSAVVRQSRHRSRAAVSAAAAVRRSVAKN